ncbi:MAG TPA: TorF family putative porin [Burkholderiaceae bacterium]|nr:TorF family putative porin [Burkholderiaceae bacterium]
MSRAVFRVAAVVLPLVAANIVNAQISGNATIVSDYRYRGVSLSQGRPVAQVDVGYDNPNGWYAGILASGVKLDYTETEQYVAYTGYAGKFLSGMNWEAGASDVRFVGESGYNYAEEFIGLTSDHFNGRVYFSPSYFDHDAHTVYAELNAAYPFQDHFQLLAHIGLLYTLRVDNGPPSPPDVPSRYDGRVGVNVKVVDWNVQLAWVALQKRSTQYPHYDDRNPHAIVLGVSYAF